MDNSQLYQSNLDTIKSKLGDMFNSVKTQIDPNAHSLFDNLNTAVNSFTAKNTPAVASQSLQNDMNYYGPATNKLFGAMSNVAQNIARIPSLPGEVAESEVNKATQGTPLYGIGKPLGIAVNALPWDLGLAAPSEAKTIAGEFKNIGEEFGTEAGAIGKLTPKNNLTTTILDQLAGKENVSKQFIEDLTNQGSIRQAERDLIRNKLADVEGNNVNVPDFVNKVKTELLPLKPGGISPDEYKSDVKMPNTASIRYENISLPDELRGPVAQYGERIYESPIINSAGGVHYAADQYPGYFAHTRIEDLPGSSMNKPSGKLGNAKSAFSQAWAGGDTRRVIELQSDLFQKGRLEDEFGGVPGKDFTENTPTFKQTVKEYNQLEPYRNTWHERIIREEIKQAAKDGKTKLQFPTGETAMKIEGLGTSNPWHYGEPQDYITDNLNLTPDKVKVGLPIFTGYGNEGSQWVITDVLGDGKFKAVQKDKLWPKAANDQSIPITVDGKKKWIMQPSEIETFDISGKVDTSNPIYKFYEKDVRKFLQNKFGGKEVTDPQGVKWMQIDVPKTAAKAPVQAYGFIKPKTLFTGAGIGVGIAAGIPLLNEALRRNDYNQTYSGFMDMLKANRTKEVADWIMSIKDKETKNKMIDIFQQAKQEYLSNK